jgi:hypothetical protein
MRGEGVCTLCFSQDSLDHGVAPDVLAVSPLRLAAGLAVPTQAHFHGLVCVSALQLLPRGFSARRRCGSEIDLLKFAHARGESAVLLVVRIF